MTTVALLAALGAVFLGVVAALVWQEAKKRTFDDGPSYVIEDAVDFIVSRLDEDTASRLRTPDVRRIVQWEVYYLQGLAQDDRRNPVETVAGGAPAAIGYIAGEIAARHGVTYAHEDIRRVLHLEAGYLMAIGAVGDQVSDGGEPR